MKEQWNFEPFKVGDYLYSDGPVIQPKEIGAEFPDTRKEDGVVAVAVGIVVMFELLLFGAGVAVGSLWL